MYCSSTPSSFVKGRFALKPLTNPGVKLFCVQANCPTSCIDTGSCHKCLCFLELWHSFMNWRIDDFFYSCYNGKFFVFLFIYEITLLAKFFYLPFINDSMLY